MEKLNRHELIEIIGGGLGSPSGPTSYLIRKLYDVAKEFLEGWNSVECSCNKE